MRKRLLPYLAFDLGCFFVFIITACQPLSTPLPPLPTRTPGPPTATATATFVWFPPTATNTPLPIATVPLTPTLNVSPLYGQQILSDDFSNPEAWTQGRYAYGTVAAGKNELSLAVTKERGYISSLLQDVTLTNFYLEITANPSICRGEDEYGVLLRIKSPQDFFRFSLTCNGQARVERLLGGTASAPQPLSFQGAVPRGAPSLSRLAVWANKNEIRFYANNQYLFSVKDTALLSGSIGLFVRASTPDAVTVNFSDLVVYQTAE